MQTADVKTLSERADELEEQMIKTLDKVPVKSPLYTMGEVDPRVGTVRPPLEAGQYLLMRDDPRLPKMPAKPTMLDFFELRFRQGGIQHLLQSANLARKNGHNEKIITACLLHDIGVVGFIQADHGYWGAQLVEPYVDEEVSWAIRMHQALRFYPDESVGYTYRSSTSATSARTTSQSRTSKPPTRTRSNTSGTCPAGSSLSTTCTLSIRMSKCTSRTSSTSWAATSANRRKGSVSTTAPWPTCGAR